MVVSHTQRKSILFALYALTFAWGVIAAAIGITALVKSNKDKDRVRKTVPPPTIVKIDVKDVFESGVVITVVSALIALTSLFSLLILIFRRNATSPLRLASFFLAFCAVWLFATIIPYDHFYATRSAKVSASINGIELPQTIIQAAERATGVTRVYKHIGYVRNLAIIPWITILFAGLNLVASFIPIDISVGGSEDHVHDEKSPTESI